MSRQLKPRLAGAACAGYDSSDEDEECAATKMAKDHMLHTVTVEQDVLDNLMSASPSSVGGLAAMVLYSTSITAGRASWGTAMKAGLRPWLPV